MYNVVLASPVTNLGTCCVLGYHGAANSPLQTYSPIDFGTTGLFGPAVGDTYEQRNLPNGRGASL